MSTTTDTIKVYWVPGCGNCTRVKGYLADRKVPFLAVNVQEDPDALAEMERAGISGVPFVRLGDRWATGNDLTQVDELIGLVHDPAGRVLDVEDLVERAATLLEAASRYARQLPPDHYGDPTPTLENFTRAITFMPDGAPYIPHGTFKSLVHHIAGHGEKFKRYAQAADGAYEVGFAVEATGAYAAFGEIVAEAPMYLVVGQMELAGKDIRAWVRLPVADRDLDRVIDTYYGKQTLLQMMQAMVCSLAQHTRQLAEVVGRFGIEPDGPVAPETFERLLMPSGIWE